MCVMGTCLRVQIHVITVIALEFFSALEKEHNDYWLCKGFIYVKRRKIYQSFTFFVSNSTHNDKSFHCDVCNVCLDKRLEGKHKCRPDSGHDECCICLEVGEDLLFFTKKTWLHIHPRQLCICWIAKLVLLLNLHEVDKGGGNKWPLGTKSCFVDMVEHQWCSTASSFRFFTCPSETEKWAMVNTL